MPQLIVGLNQNELSIWIGLKIIYRSGQCYMEITHQKELFCLSTMLCHLTYDQMYQFNSMQMWYKQIFDCVQVEVFAEIGEVISGKKPALREKTTVFKSLGKADPWILHNSKIRFFWFHMKLILRFFSHQEWVVKMLFLLS